MEEAEAELARVLPPGGKAQQQEVREDLDRKQAVRDELRKATDEVLAKMKELAETLNSVSGKEQQQELEKEVSLKSL